MTEPNIQFDVVNDPFGDQTGNLWNHGPVSETAERDESTSRDAIGNETAYKQHNERKSYTQSFTASDGSTAPTVPPSIGNLEGSALLTEISLSTGLDFHEMTLTGHQHDDNAHADTLKQAEHGITLTTPHGAVDFLTSTAGTAASLISSTCVIRIINHVDIQDGDGDHLVGNNDGAEIEVTQIWQGIPTVLCGDADFRLTGEPKEEEVGGFIQLTVNAKKPLDIDDPA